MHACIIQTYPSIHTSIHAYFHTCIHSCRYTYILRLSSHLSSSFFITVILRCWFEHCKGRVSLIQQETNLCRCGLSHHHYFLLVILTVVQDTRSVTHTSTPRIMTATLTCGRKVVLSLLDHFPSPPATPAAISSAWIACSRYHHRLLLHTRVYVVAGAVLSYLCMR